jgi:phosphoglycerate-specific signal transduction histidine kinase
MGKRCTVNELETKIQNLEEAIIKDENNSKNLAENENNCKKIIQKEKLQTISELVRALCHELNQPLQAISGYSDLIKFTLSEDSPNFQNFNQIKTQIDKASIITKKLMGVTKYIN